MNKSANENNQKNLLEMTKLRFFVTRYYMDKSWHMNSRKQDEITKKMPVPSDQGDTIFFDAYRSETWKNCKFGNSLKMLNVVEIE